MKNLFAIGCSFTNFQWPSWAHWTGTLFDNTITMGASGAGNRYLFNCVSYLISENHITKDDTVIIQWSGIPREDKVLGDDGYYTFCGNIQYQEFYSKEYVRDYFNVVQTASELVGYINVLKLALDQIGCEYHMTNMFDYHIEDFLGEPTCPYNSPSQYELTKQYGILDRLEILTKQFLRPSLEEFKWDYDDIHYVNYGTDKMDITRDDHPSSYAHYRYAIDVIAPKLKNTTNTIESLDNPENLKLANEWAEYFRDKDKVNQLIGGLAGAAQQVGLPYPSNHVVITSLPNFIETNESLKFLHTGK